MNFFVRAVVSGFAFSLGAAVFKRVSKELGLDEKPATTAGAATQTSSGDASLNNVGNTADIRNAVAHSIATY
jgi:hypothetical protein